MDYLVDNEGFIRYDHIGEGGYAETEKMIQSLLAEPGMKKSINATTTYIPQANLNGRFESYLLSYITA